MEYPAQVMVGPALARHLAYRMYRGEYFAMQVDSHVQFVQDWDEDIIDQWTSTNNEMAVLSTYLQDIHNSIDPVTHQSLRRNLSVMCKIEYEWDRSPNEHLKNGIQPTHEPVIHKPMLNPFWAAGFSFGRGHFVVQVPYDQYLPLVFQGEEISMTVRGYTYGYDYYAPVRNVAFHIYAIKDNKEKRGLVSKFTENEVMFPGVKNKGYLRLNGIIGTENRAFKTDYRHEEEGNYGVGQYRQKESFFRTLGIHTDTKEIEEGLCDFVQGRAGVESMHSQFTPYLRYDGMGIDYRRIKYTYSARKVDESPISEDELAMLRAQMKKLSKHTNLT
jgi:[Skp1-protein]-hydroxyproline N-acetylglucosaminyltransferase